MAKYGRGLVCLAMTEERLDHLRLGPMSVENTSQYGTAFCEAIDARVGVTTGISAYDRARTIQVAIDPTKGPDARIALELDPNSARALAESILRTLEQVPTGLLDEFANVSRVALTTWSDSVRHSDQVL